MKKSVNLTAIVIALNEETFITTCLKAIYDFVQRIVIVTNYDTDFYGNKLNPDSTVDLILKFPDPGEKIILMVYRNIKDEFIMRPWAMETESALPRIAKKRFLTHAFSLEEIRNSYPKTDYYWIIDADEIYDPETIPQMIDFAVHSRASAIAIRGYNYFKKWNYRTNLENDQFWQIGFLKPGRSFYVTRALYNPRCLGWVSHISPGLSERLIRLYRREIKLPEKVGHFYHGSYIGDTERIRKKVFTSSHANQRTKEEKEFWINNVWEKWNPQMKDFYFKPNQELFSGVDYFPTEKLPRIIRESNWPDNWIER